MRIIYFCLLCVLFSTHLSAETVNYDCASFEPYVDCEVVEEAVEDGTLSNADCLGILDYVKKAINRDVCCATSPGSSKRLNLDDGPNPPVPPDEDDSIENNACDFLNPINGGSQFSIDVDKAAHCTGLDCQLNCSPKAYSRLETYTAVAACNARLNYANSLHDMDFAIPHN